MTDMLKTGSDWLETQRQAFATRTVTYTRGEAQVDVSASIGKTLFEVDAGSFVAERIESRDYLIFSADLVLDEVQVLPERGDRIRETDGEVVYVYEVLAPGSEPHFRFSDPYRKTLRVHTKLVDTEVA